MLFRSWTFHRIWSTNWFSDPEAEVAKVQEDYREAVGKIGTDPAPDDEASPGVPSTGSAVSPGVPSTGPAASPGVPSTGPAGSSPGASSAGPGASAPGAPSPGGPPEPGHALAVREPAAPEPTQTFPS